MTETWRKKPYYKPRVLIGVQDCLASTYDGVLVCLTAGQVNVLRNLLEYAKRRSTFVSSYEESYYIAPSATEWDGLQAMIADLEDKLMGCEDIGIALENIADALDCVCHSLRSMQAQGQPQDDGYSGQRQYDDYTSDVIEDVDPVPGGFGTWDAWRVAKCKGARKMVDDVIAATNDIGQKIASGFLITFTVINGLLLLSVLAAPIAVVIQVVALFISIGIGYAYIDVSTWLGEHKESLVCLIYNAATANAAYDGLRAYIDAQWDISPSKEPTKLFFTYEGLSTIFDGDMRDYTSWEGQYEAGYCSGCSQLELGVAFGWVWPPCQNGSHVDGGVCDGGRLCFNGNISDAHQQHEVDLASWNRVTITTTYRSRFPSGWTVGNVLIDWWDSGVPGWVMVAQSTMNTSEPAGNLNTLVTVVDRAAVTGGLVRTRVVGQPGQNDTSPYPMQVETIDLLYELL